MILSALSIAFLAGSCFGGSPSLVDQLCDAGTSVEAFNRAIRSERRRVLEEDRIEPYRLEFDSAHKLTLLTGKLGVLAYLRGRPAPCGTGLMDAGITGPVSIALPPDLQSVLVMSESGSPMYQVTNGRSNLCPFDTDNDGLPDVLIRWNHYFEHGRPPFVAIHDLTRPKLPVMVSISLNVKAAREITPLFTPEYPEVPKGAWRFASGLQLVIAMEGRDIGWFHYDSTLRTWSGPADDSSGFWAHNKDVWAGARFTDYTLTD